MLEPSLTAICGMTGSGKTTFGIKYLLNAPAAVYLIFDFNERIGPRLPFPSCYTENELGAAIPSRWVIFNPKRMFPGAAFDKKQGTAALRYFAKFAREVAKSGRGKKFFYVPELWMFCNDDSIPTELALLCQDGRQDEVEVVIDTQRPELINGSIMGACTELICFRLQELDALRTIGKYGMDKDAVSKLPIGHPNARYIALNRLSGGTVEANLFGDPKPIYR